MKSFDEVDFISITDFENPKVKGSSDTKKFNNSNHSGIIIKPEMRQLKQGYSFRIKGSNSSKKIYLKRKYYKKKSTRNSILERKLIKFNTEEKKDKKEFYQIDIGSINSNNKLRRCSTWKSKVMYRLIDKSEKKQNNGNKDKTIQLSNPFFDDISIISSIFSPKNINNSYKYGRTLKKAEQRPSKMTPQNINSKEKEKKSPLASISNLIANNKTHTRTLKVLRFINPSILLQETEHVKIQSEYFNSAKYKFVFEQISQNYKYETQVEMTASCRFLSTFTLRISCSNTSQMCSVRFRASDWESHQEH